ncbi:hypothetical protein [Pelagibacterium sp.]|uniref:hypothetical protein n=1 Tax=Pelagibacterium sp. TaxID=1967288 RepID=UPI003A8D2814
MANLLQSIAGNAIVSLNDTPGVRETFGAFRMEKVDLTYSIGQGTGGTKAVGEMLIYTFPETNLPLFG